MGRILGIEFNRNQQAPNNFLVVLLVQNIIKKTQTTVLEGQSLLFSHTGNSPQNLYFSELLKEWTGHPRTWAELSQVPLNTTNLPSDFQLIPQAPPVKPVAVHKATLLATGYDPLKGYWAEFAGNYNLYFGLFQGDWYNTVAQ